MSIVFSDGGEGWIRTTEGDSRQIYRQLKPTTHIKKFPILPLIFLLFNQHSQHKPNEKSTPVTDR